MSLQTTGDLFSIIFTPTLPFPFGYIPNVFRALAIIMAAPFLFFMALDLVAYAITRTLHISIERLRVPASPPSASRRLPDVDEQPDDADVDIAAELDSPQRKSVPLPDLGSGKAASPILALLVVLFAALLQWTTQTSNDIQLSALAGDAVRPRAVVLTAHPDDEAMFFAPSILSMVDAGWDMHAICISDGNADGLGLIRTEELYQSYARLGLKADKVALITHPSLQDSMNASLMWDSQLVANLIAPYLDANAITHLVTFDSQGVSQHPNHIALSDVHARLNSYLDTADEVPRPQLLQLESPPLATKYTGPFWAVLLALRELVARTLRSSSAKGDDVLEAAKVATLISSPTRYAQAIRAMLAHRSQLVWFRWLYVAFSQLMWVNRLVDLGH